MRTPAGSVIVSRSKSKAIARHPAACCLGTVEHGGRAADPFERAVVAGGLERIEQRRVEDAPRNAGPAARFADHVEQERRSDEGPAGRRVEGAQLAFREEAAHRPLVGLEHRAYGREICGRAGGDLHLRLAAHGGEAVNE